MAGYRTAEEFWSDGHPCCDPLGDAERDGEYLEWRAKSAAENEL